MDLTAYVIYTHCVKKSHNEYFIKMKVRSKLYYFLITMCQKFCKF